MLALWNQYTHMYDHTVVLIKHFNQLGQSHLTKVLPKGLEVIPPPTISHRHWTKAHTLGSDLAVPSRPTAAAASETKLQPSHILDISSTQLSLVSSWERSWASHLLLEVALAVPLLLWLHPHSQRHSLAAHSGTSNTALAECPGQVSDHSCST